MSDESISFLIARLNHSEYSERRKAEDALVELGEAAIASLIAVVEQQGIIAVLRAASALSRLGDERGILPVARLLLRGGENNMDVVQFLAYWKPEPTHYQPNSPKRYTPEYDLVLQARNFLGISGYQSLTGAGQQEIFYRGLVQSTRNYSPGWVAPSMAAPKATTTATPDDIPGLIQTLRSSNHTLREAATAKLIGLGRDAVPALLEALSLDSPLARYRAVEALGQVGDARAVEPLLKLRKTLDMDILESVNKALPVLARHLAERPTSTEIPQLIALIQHLRFDAQTQSAAIAAAKALETLAHTHPTPQLRGALKWLKSLWAPLPADFKEARKVIEEATKQWKDLPLVADAPQETTENLPRPASNESEPNE
ncbi:HEAT repeat domain-containing protein [Armatimonas sp.]|uniref:HEAT repeat domain-containing protein n=1 Tax=Armatimonas sp. TaxID=1872638 RepID=UPI00286C1EBD|nr:HEAT repeat domain-containing protein [Armatimonas sp.]